MESEDYYAKLDKITDDKTKFVEIRQDADIHPIVQKENSVSYYVKKYLNKVNDFEKLIPVGSKPEKLYGMANVHKDQVPLRPVVSMVGTREYNLAKYLDQLIKPYIPDTYLLRSTDDFIERLKQFLINCHNIVLSFDVVSLFTNVSLAETIELIIDRLYSRDNPNLIPVTADIFQKLIFLTTQGLFMYKNRLYEQIDDVTMGCPLGPTLANFFLRCIEQKLFENKSDFLPLVCLRYIDDIYCVFETESASLAFLQMLNSQHAAIKFTIKKETNRKSLTFLDVQIQLTDKGYNSCVWRKPTNTGLLLNYKADCPKTRNLVLLCVFYVVLKIYVLLYM